MQNGNFPKEDIYFKVTDYTPQTRLKDVRNFTGEKQIHLSDHLVFFFNGVKLRGEQTMRSVKQKFQKKDRTKPVLIYAREVNFAQFSTRQIKDHFDVLYVQTDAQFYDDRITKQRIELEREKLRKLKEVY